MVIVLGAGRAGRVIIIGGRAACPVFVFLLHVGRRAVAFVGNDVIHHPRVHRGGSEHAFLVYAVVFVKCLASKRPVYGPLAVLGLRYHALCQRPPGFLLVRVDYIVAFFVDAVIYDRIGQLVRIRIVFINCDIVYYRRILRVEGLRPVQDRGCHRHLLALDGPRLAHFLPVI